MNIDEPCPNYVVWCGGHWGVDLCDRTDQFVEQAREGMRLLKRLFSVGKSCDGSHLVSRWALVFAEVLASSGVCPSEALYRVRYDEPLRDGVKAALALGGYVGLRGYLIAQGVVGDR